MAISIPKNAVFISGTEMSSVYGAEAQRLETEVRSLFGRFLRSPFIEAEQLLSQAETLLGEVRQCKAWSCEPIHWVHDTAGTLAAEAAEDSTADMVSAMRELLAARDNSNDPDLFWVDGELKEGGGE